MPKKTKTLKALKQALADTYTLYLKSQNYHWNVSGPRFKVFHEMFEEHYGNLAESIDEIAERIVTLGDKAPGSFKLYNKLRTLDDGNEEANPASMLEDALKSHQKIQKTFRTLMESAKEEDDPVSEGLAIDRLGYHEKICWMLKSILM